MRVGQCKVSHPVRFFNRSRFGDKFVLFEGLSRPNHLTYPMKMDDFPTHLAWRLEDFLKEYGGSVNVSIVSRFRERYNVGFREGLRAFVERYPDRFAWRREGRVSYVELVRKQENIEIAFKRYVEERGGCINTGQYGNFLQESGFDKPSMRLRNWVESFPQHFEWIQGQVGSSPSIRIASVFPDSPSKRRRIPSPRRISPSSRKENFSKNLFTNGTDIQQSVSFGNSSVPGYKVENALDDLDEFITREGGLINTTDVNVFFERYPDAYRYLARGKLEDAIASRPSVFMIDTTGPRKFYVSVTLPSMWFMMHVKEAYVCFRALANVLPGIKVTLEQSALGKLNPYGRMTQPVPVMKAYAETLSVVARELQLRSPDSDSDGRLTNIILLARKLHGMPESMLSNQESLAEFIRSDSEASGSQLVSIVEFLFSEGQALMGASKATPDRITPRPTSRIRASDCGLRVVSNDPSRGAFTGDQFQSKGLQRNQPRDKVVMDLTGSPRKGVAKDIPVLLARRELESNRHGAAITPAPSSVSQTGFIPRLPVMFVVENIESDSTMVLEGVDVFDPRKGSRPVQIGLVSPFKGEVKLDHPHQVSVSWLPRCPCGPVRIHVAQVDFNFSKMNDKNQTIRFSISRFIAVDDGGREIIDEALLNNLRPEREYFPAPSYDKLTFEKGAEFPSQQRLNDGPHLSVALREIDVDRSPETVEKAKPGIVLTTASYEARMRALLHVQFANELDELEKADLRNVTVVKGEGGLWWVEMYGLGERRPSVLVGDKVIAMNAQTQKGSLGGRVKVVEQNRVGIQFSYAPKDSVAVHIRFIANPYSFLMCHAAIDSVLKTKFLERIAIPYAAELERDVAEARPDEVQRQYRNSMIREIPSSRDERDALERDRAILGEHSSNALNGIGLLPCVMNLNEFQRQAVETIVGRMPSRRILPFLVFGPPGTGKTTTLVAAVASLLFSRRDSRILVSAPSNAACDLFLSQLRKTLDEMNMGYIKSCRVLSSALAGEMQENASDPAVIKRSRVVVATCVTSGKLSSLETGFTHVVVDEAAQCTEPEALIPLCMASQASKRPQLILGGDHQQLGPVVLSPEASSLEMSLFERLMKAEPFCSLDRDFACLLENNYRSHADLIKVPSDLFYLGKLKAKATGKTSLLHWSGLPVKGCPLVIYHVEGKEDRENISPSWFNLAECVKTVELLKSLIKEERVPVEDCIVIAPYTGQVKKLRRMLSAQGLHNCRVDTVERFQGGEARVVIVSTTRSSSMTDDYDAKFHVGFLKNHRRMNVAVTRAKELLIVLGNMHVLKSEKHWGALVKFARSKGAIQGMTGGTMGAETIDLTQYADPVDLTEDAGPVDLTED